MLIEREKMDETNKKDEMSKDQRLEWLMNEYGQSITRLAFTYTKQQQFAEDIAQDVFIKCYEKLDQFRYESSYKTWLYRITINLCKDRLKSWSFRNVFFTEFFAKWGTSVESPEAELMKSVSSQFISEKIISLPLKYREVIIFYYYEEFTYQQISELLNLNLPTVKSRLYRARLLLKEKLEGGSMDE